MDSVNAGGTHRVMGASQNRFVAVFAAPSSQRGDTRCVLEAAPA
jgi:hypothetical protein